MPITKHQKRILLFHAAFWAVYVSFLINHIASYQKGTGIDWGRVLGETAISVGYVAALSYLNYFYLIPALLIRKKIGAFVTAFMLSFALLTFLRFEVDGLIFGFERATAISGMTTSLVVQGIISDLFIVVFVGLLRFAADWLELDARRRELEKEKLSAELKFLKAQVNPHFLFNTLNNLFYLATIGSDSTPLVVAKLSEVMRYMMFDSSRDKVELAKEIEYMQHYIHLERLRLRDEVRLDFEVVGRTNLLISPLILITFLENAFKHGASGTSAPAWIRARLEVDEERLEYRIGNSKPAKAVKGKPTPGIGLTNVQRRLDLSYPGRYTLDIDDREDVYYVHLIINYP
ncbi:MAG TPA: histidine kinase [Puia sp.]|nr:histidine kinase [Puia sp.]